MMIRKILVLGCMAVSAGLSSAVTLVENGVAKCRIVVAEDVHPALKFGAKELEKYLAKATGCDFNTEAQRHGDLYPIRVKSLCASVPLCSELKEDGFILDVKPTGIDVIGANPRGALYGCYEILKRYAGMRWLVPGEDGEYCVLQGESVVVPEGRTVCNPDLRCRRAVAGGKETYLWYARNNMFGSAHERAFVSKSGKKAATCDLYEALCVKGEGTYGNSHILSEMMCNWATKDALDRMRELYEAHPDYFPLLNGKRQPTTHVPVGGISNPNPCVGNPAIFDLMAENLYKRIGGRHGADEYITIGNNDTTVWCECEKCRALDAPELAGTKGARADRYWYAVMEVAKRVWKKDPSIRLGGWAYQDFWYPPKHVKIDPRLRIMVSFNNQCWRHAVDDPKCPVNAEWRRIFEAWKKTGLPLVINRDEIACGGALGSSYAPAESVLRDNFRAYPAYGCAGSSFCVDEPFPSFLKHRKNQEPFYGKNYRWYAMWQTCYMSARLMWDGARDFDAELEEANRLYYGAAWEGGMKAFRAELKRIYFAGEGCLGWALGTTVGSALQNLDDQRRLTELLDKAEAAAKASGDARTMAHVARDREIFGLTWLKEAERYRVSYRELKACPRQGPIVIDGRLDEADWQDAPVLSGFEAGGHTPKGTKVQPTKVRVVHSPEALYVSVECFEPEMDKRIADAVLPSVPSKAYSRLGDHVEIFYNYPDMADKCYHLFVNSKGAMMESKILSPVDHDFTCRTQAKWAVRDFEDRWILELELPTSAIGMKCFEGAVWKLNVGRCRKIEGGGPFSETSSACCGAFRGVPGFANLKFVARPPRTEADANAR